MSRNFLSGIQSTANTWTTPQTFSAGSLFDKGNYVYDVKAYGAKADTKQVADGVMTAASAILTSATANFTAIDVGKSIAVAGAGASAVRLLTTIASFQSSTQVTLTVAATTAVSAVYVVYGTDDTTAIQNAITAAVNAGNGGLVALPSAKYFISGNGLAVSSLSVSLEGNGARQTMLYYVGSGACVTWRLSQTAYTLNYGVGTAAVPSMSSSFGAKIQNMTIDGSQALAGAIGLEYGDINGACLDDVNVQSFNGTGSVGIHVNNIYTWTEEARWNQIELTGNTTGILFDRQNRTDASITLTSGSASFTDAAATAADVGKTVFVLAGSAYLGQIKSVVGTTVTTTVAVAAASAGVQSLLVGGTTSWDYHKMYGIWIGPNNNQTGIKFQNGGELAASILHITGNCGYQTNASTFIWATGNAFISNNTCHLAVENDGVASSGTFIRVDSGSAMHMNGTVYAGNFGTDNIAGTFKPSGSWITPTIRPNNGAIIGRDIEAYGTYVVGGDYPTMTTDGTGGAVIANPVRNDNVTVTNASTTITDVTVVAADVGKQVIVQNAAATGLSVGANIGAVSSVIPGVSFVLNRALPAITTGTATLTLQGYAINFRPLGTTSGQMSVTYTGTLNVSGGINSAPSAASNAATVVLGTPLQNNSNNGFLTVYLSITVNTSLVIKAGTGNTGASATANSQTVVTGVTQLGIVPVSLLVPNSYFGTVSFTGTGTVAVMAAMWSYM